jgi:hypothetical protein
MKLGNRKANASDEECVRTVQPADDARPLEISRISAMLQCFTVPPTCPHSTCQAAQCLLQIARFQGRAPWGLPAKSNVGVRNPFVPYYTRVT